MMVQRQRLARRYAQALVMLAEERQLIDRVEADMEYIQQVLDENEELRYFLFNEQVPPTQRCDLLRTIFAAEIADITLHFLFLIVHKHRTRYLDDMIDEFVRYSNERRGIIVVRVTSAQEMKDHIADNLAVGLGKALDAQVRLRTFIDPALLGGVVIQVGDLLIDGSAVSRLARLGKSLKAAQLN